MVAPLWVNHDYLTTIDLRSAYWQLSPLTMQNFVAIVEKMLEIAAIEYLCSQKKWAKVHQNRLRPDTS